MLSSRKISVWTGEAVIKNPSETKKDVPSRWSKRAEYSVVAISLIPPLLLGLLILKYGVDLIDWDQWEIAALFEKASNGSLSVGDLFAQQAEYRQFFPNLIFVGLGWLTHWNIKYEMMVSFLLGCLIASNLFHLGKLTIGGNRSTQLLLLLVSNLLIFSPAQFESWLLGEQIIYFMPVACLTTGLRVAYSRLNQQAKLILCMLLSTISTFSSANGIICWIVIAPVLLFSNPQKTGKNWRSALWVIGFILNLTLYFHNFHKPSYTPRLSESLQQPLDALLFFCAFLGAPLATSNRLILVSAGIGAILATLFIMSCFYVWKFSDEPELKCRLMCWVMLGAYSFITGVMVTIGRLGFGPNQALSSRYITFSVYLLVSLCYLVPIILDDLRRQGRLEQIKAPIPRLIPLALSSLILLHLLNSAAAVRQMAWMKTRRLQAKACLLFINAAPNECLSKGFPDLSVLRARTNAINDLGFLRPGLIKSNKIEEIAVPITEDLRSYGEFEKLSKSQTAVFDAVGWASLPERGGPADAVLLTYQKDQGDPLILAFSEMSIYQPSFATFFMKAPSSTWRWQKSISLDTVPVAPPVTISAWAFDATTSKAYKLHGTYVIENEVAPVAFDK